jgi:hypothetical protein
MWIDQNGSAYEGDCATGDRAATDEEVSAVLLDRAKAGKLNDIETAYQAALLAGVAWQGNHFEIDDASQQKISSVAVRAGFATLSVVPWPSDFEFISLDNVHVAFAAADFLAFAVAAFDRAEALFMQRRALKDAVAAAGTIDAVAAVDPSMGEG